MESQWNYNAQWFLGVQVSGYARRDVKWEKAVGHVCRSGEQICQ